MYTHKKCRLKYIAEAYVHRSKELNIYCMQFTQKGTVELQKEQCTYSTVKLHKLFIKHLLKVKVVQACSYEIMHAINNPLWKSILIIVILCMIKNISKLLSVLW